MKQGGLSTGELEDLEDLKAVATIAVMVGGIRYAHQAYNEGDVGKLIISALHFLIAGFLCGTTFINIIDNIDLGLTGSSSDFINYSDSEL